MTRQPIRSDSGMVVSHMTARVNFHSRPPGSGQVCDGCGAAITTHQTMTLRLDTADWSETRGSMTSAFTSGSDEGQRLKDPQPGRVRSTPAKKDRVA